MDASLPSGDFIAGLTDGEGCFALKFRREVRRSRPGMPAYFGWQAAFIIVLRKDDIELLEKVQQVLGCGKISFSRNSARFQVQDTDELLYKLIPFFEQHRLFGKKSKDFILWKEALSLIASNKKRVVNARKGVKGFIKVNWDENALHRLGEIRKQMIQYKSVHPPFKWE